MMSMLKECLIVFLKSECLYWRFCCSALWRMWRLSPLDISSKSWLILIFLIYLIVLRFLCHEWSSIALVFAHLLKYKILVCQSIFPATVHSCRPGFIGIPLHSVNLPLVVARIYWCGSKLKVLAKMSTLKMERVGSWMTSKGWSVSSALMIRQSKIHGSLFEPFAGESLTIPFRSRVGVYWAMAQLRSGEGCKPQAGGDACPQCVDQHTCGMLINMYALIYAKASSRQGSTAREPINLMSCTKQTSLPEGRSNRLKVNPMSHNSPDTNPLSAVVFCAH